VCVPAIGTELGRRLPEAFAEFHLDGVFGKPYTATGVQFLRIVGDHRLEVSGDEIAEALPIAALRFRRGRECEDERNRERREPQSHRRAIVIPEVGGDDDPRHTEAARHREDLEVVCLSVS